MSNWIHSNYGQCQRNKRIVLYLTTDLHLITGWVRVFDASFNNISVISWRSVLLVKETGVPTENHRPTTSHWQTLSHNFVSWT